MYMENVNNNNSLVSSPSARPQDPIICQCLEIIINIGVYGAFPHMASKYIVLFLLKLSFTLENWECMHHRK